MIKAIQSIRRNGVRLSPGDTIEGLTPLEVEQLKAAGAIAVEPDPDPTPTEAPPSESDPVSPQKSTRRKA